MSKVIEIKADGALGDLPVTEFRAALHRAADWVADYRATIESRPISDYGRPGDFAAAFPSKIPEMPVPMDALIDEVDRLILPSLVHWGHPAFLGYFGSTTTAPGIVAELMAGALNVSAMTWATSPAATELESVVLGWLREMLRLPRSFFGIVYDTASIAILHALAAARERLQLNTRELGLAGRPDIPRLRIYASDQAHSSIVKAAITLGIGEANVVFVPSDHRFRMNPHNLKQAIEEDRRAGFSPLAVIATVGTTSAAAVDPVAEIAQVCAAEEVWLHVDAAYGGAMGILPEGRFVMEGVSSADSVVVNPHKWLFVPLDFSVLFIRNPHELRQVFALVPEYLSGDAELAEINYMDYGLQLGRRFRALKAWMVFSTFGETGLVARIREHLRLANLFADWMSRDGAFELLAPVEMAVVCFRAIGKNGHSLEQINDLNKLLVKTINRSGRAYLTHTQLKEKVAMRIAVGNVLTTEQHLANVFRVIKEALQNS